MTEIFYPWRHKGLAELRVWRNALRFYPKSLSKYQSSLLQCAVLNLVILRPFSFIHNKLPLWLH